MKTLGNILDNKTLESLTKAKQLNRDLNQLNVLIEGKLAFCSSFFCFVFFFSSIISINNCIFSVFKCIRYTLRYGALVSFEVFCTEMIQDWELYRDHQDVDPEVVRRSTEVAQGMVAWMRKMDLSPREPIATDESSEAHDCEKPLTGHHHHSHNIVKFKHLT